ncbi:hypothetical protein PR202_ga11023 [Eleusine coracana subsp. coracana]|uniref:DUF6598 domain-containing protein n=1 Tax=Eleusine coracana subsp. coracana TaxID=191504 RepID=A0AAV5C803_ELECO|nr:hypothetical protein PR202_ga11023 [Eleusine coracana subsp. coracana]
MQPVAGSRRRTLTPAEQRRKAYYAAQGKEVEVRKMAEEVDEDDEEEMARDMYAFQASRFRESWEVQWFGFFGLFEDTNKKPERRHNAFLCNSLQIFSLKVAGISEGLQWPLHVFGTAFLRDSADHNRNTIFNRGRDNCQIITQEVPYLTLTGPTRAVVLLDPVTFEVDLKVKGTTESEDKHLSSLAAPFMCSIPLRSYPLKRDYTSKLSTLEFALGFIGNYSIEATIAIRITRGSWPDGLRAQFAARTTSIGHEEIILLDSGDNEVLVDDDGWITLSRRVASVEIDGWLKVAVKALLGDEIIVTKEKCFSPKKAGRSGGIFDVGLCHMDVTVAWSLISPSV